MDKKRADYIIEDYMKPIYSFAFNKMGNLEEAEELAARIIVEVYYVLCYKNDFNNLNGYIFKIAHNIWVKYLKEKVNKKCEAMLEQENVFKSEKGLDEYYIDKETEGVLRREIAYLSKQQREIVIAYYYKRMKIKEIVKQFNLPEGTVKWNLFDIKKELKNSMNTVRTIGNLGINPIKFGDMGHTGSPGEKGDTRDFLTKVITQNIAYAAYHKPLSIREIAGELGISPVFIEDEVQLLEEYGFMELLPGGKYRTNMIIFEPSLSEEEELHRLSQSYAKILYEKYYKSFLDLERIMKEIGVYYPDSDYNCLLWSLIPYANRFLDFPENDKIEGAEVMVYRKDGGKYIAMAVLDKQIDVPFEQEKFICMYMMRRAEDGNNIEGWQVSNYWSGRAHDWRDNKYSDYVSLMYFIQEKLVESEVTEEVYSRLLEKEYLIKTEEGYKVNIVYIENKVQMEALEAVFPKPSKEIRKLSLEYDEKVYQIRKIAHPSHMHKAIRYISQGGIRRLWPYIFEEMLERGDLKEPTKEQKKAISTWMYIRK